MIDMTQMLDSMENSIRLQHQARAERRAEEAQRTQQEFKEKLHRAAVSKIEADSTSAKLKGAEEAQRRDQLMGLLMAGL
ncbi:MAG: hypothetical protein HFH48_07435 [Lachnospiraceae bacterium]|nr:hypothetical protein [Lachnospiraceae bacterium]